MRPVESLPISTAGAQVRPYRSLPCAPPPSLAVRNGHHGRDRCKPIGRHVGVAGLDVRRLHPVRLMVETEVTRLADAAVVLPPGLEMRIVGIAGEPLEILE